AALRIQAVSGNGADSRVGPLSSRCLGALGTFPLRARDRKAGMKIKRREIERFEVPFLRRLRLAVEIFFEELAERRVIERSGIEFGGGLGRGNGARLIVRAAS